MRRWIVVVALFLAAASSGAQSPATAADTPPPSTTAGAQSPAATPDPANPMLMEWNTPFAVPPFDRIKPEHFLPAFQEAIARHNREVDAIAKTPVPASFANTVEALDGSGELLTRVGQVFGQLSSAETNDALQAISRQTAPMLAAHQDDITLSETLFRRVRAVWDAREKLSLEPDQKTLLDRTWKRFVRGGALLDAKAKERLRAINSELAALSVKFSDNLLKETNAYRLVVDNRADLSGLPDRVTAGAADAAKNAGLEGKWLFTLHSPSLWPFLQYADNRELRRRMFTAYTTRADHGDATDNKTVLARIASLRTERAQLLGYKTYADFALDETMAKSPARVYELLDKLWPRAKKVAAREAETLQAAIRADGKDFKLEPWDWFYYTEKVRQTRYSLDEQELRPYFQVDRVREGVFHVANRLYGITITPLPNMPVYNPEVSAYEVKDADGSHLAVFYADYHPRPGKRGGAWSGGYRGTWVKDGKSIRPVVVNVCNFSRPAGDAPALLSLEETETMFHEFGHALHAMLSRVRYRGVAQVQRDFGEVPSSIMENWALEPEVLKAYAKHYQTGEVIPQALVDKVRQSKKFNQGFASTEYLAACLLDMDWHTLAAPREPDARTFEDSSMRKIGMPAEIVSRYRSPYFAHIFSGGYASGYYNYIWSEVLDADAFHAFKEKGIFDPATARSFRQNVLERGGSEDAMTLYKRFRGREPVIEPLLERRGLDAAGSSAP
ncbi:MAG: M3 family metallopeptidase [Candidatus Eisenbacteria bacterium]|nr:M3 family metallopeptidase [Candidatus Eisenbacteria bacterium]